MSEFSRELHSFVEVARECSIRKAADKLNISSSALSRQMRLLEEDLGTALFARHAKGMQLTADGLKLLSQAERWLSESTHLRASLARKDRGNEKKLRIGAAECFAQTLLPALYDRQTAAGRLDVLQVRTGDTNTLIHALSEGEIDLALAFNARPSQPVRVLSETSCRIGLVYSPIHFTVDRHEISIAECLDWPVSLPSENLSVHSRLLSEIHRQRKRPRIVSSSNSVRFTSEMVRNGHAVAFMTRFDVRPELLAGGIRFVPLKDQRMEESVCVCVNANAELTTDLQDHAKTAAALINAIAQI
ncbi:LysR family transcriptional regulator [Leisingera sp. ANG-M6]|uniref:LysR family transcriptional regulator n=1 Tax=Leisingera sp. ANG-M6 TaxID=1577900 RepID=UPI00057DEB36|nr:LysR family transcriptional regulator [Leisingera sp. ANG-M6]KIC28251.1 hypothetical protein RA24_09920 [Leisingera sp. ANG-M6]